VPIWLQARRTAEQGIILKAATLPIQQPDELLPDVIGNGIGRPGGLGVSDAVWWICAR
jgi:hypothetical protein